MDGDNDGACDDNELGGSDGDDMTNGWTGEMKRQLGAGISFSSIDDNLSIAVNCFQDSHYKYHR